MVRCFEDNDIIHVNGKVDPSSDIDVINLELVFADMDQVCQVNFLQLHLLLCITRGPGRDALNVV